MLLDNLRKNIPFLPYINTGTLFDFSTGKFQPIVGNLHGLNGGLSQCTGISGRSQTYKSGLAGSLLARAMNIHPLSEAYVYESEGTISGPERYNDFVPIDQQVSNRIVFQNNTMASLTEFYEVFNNIVSDKEKNKKDYIVESPFLNPNDGKPMKVWIPTFVLIDSFSRARSDKGDKQFESNNIDDSSMNTFWLSEGNIKTRIMNDLPGRAAKAGIYVIMTAHVGDKHDLDPYNKSPKQLQYMKNTDKMKNVGSNFEFLTTTLIQTLKATVLQDKSKGCEYPTNFSTDVEVNQVDTMLVRCKNNASGMLVPYIVSQYQGILNEVTNFVFLKNYKNYGMNVKGNNMSFTPALYPDAELTRTNIRKKTTDNYKLCRALELTTQLCFIQNLWSTYRMPEWIKIDPMKFAELLTHNEKLKIDRVLESTGCWSTSKQEREMLTIIDILQFLHEQK